MIWELVDTDSPPQPKASVRAEGDIHRGKIEDPKREDEAPTLQLDQDSILVLDIHRMKPIYTKMPTERVRHNKSDLF